jgi:glucose/arabinose dehydrogenase
MPALNAGRVLLRAIAIVVLASAITLPGVASAAESYQSQHYTLRLVTVAEGLEKPWSLAWLPDGHMLVTEPAGRLRIATLDGTVSQPIRGVLEVAYGGQGGLLDVLVDPDFQTNRTIYFSFSEPGEGGKGTSVARAELDGDRIANLRILFRQLPKSSGSGHFGWRLVIARDGTLFITSVSAASATARKTRLLTAARSSTYTRTGASQRITPSSVSGTTARRSGLTATETLRAQLSIP